MARKTHETPTGGFAGLIHFHAPTGGLVWVSASQRADLSALRQTAFEDGNGVLLFALEAAHLRYLG